MANTSIQVKKSATSGNVPATLNYGELALNYADGKLYYKNASGVITYISGASINSFSTINVSSSLILATSNTDTLTILGANGIDATACTVTKTITIDGSGVYNQANSAYSLAQSAFNKANTGGSGGGATYLTVQDNGTTISNTVNTINFIGTTIQSFNSGNGVNITVSGFPLLDLGLISDPTTAYDYVDFGTLP